MSEQTKWKFAVITLSIMLVAILSYTAIVLSELYVGKYGEITEAKVVDDSNVCRHKNKRITILIDGKRKNLRLYGSRCRDKEFREGAMIYLRRNKKLDIVVVQDNQNGVRAVFFPVFTLAVFFALRQVIRSRKKKLATGHE